MERLPEPWSGLKPSRGLVADGMSMRDGVYGKPCSSFRGREWSPEWAPSWAPSCFQNESHGPSAGLALEPGAARWNRPSSEKHHSGALHDYSPFQPHPVAQHRQGWDRTQTSEFPAAANRDRGDQRQHHFGGRPCSKTKFDEEMNVYESNITRAVSGQISKALLKTISLGQEIATPPAESPVVSLPGSTDADAAAAAAAAAASDEKKPSEDSLQCLACDAASNAATPSSSQPTLMGTSSNLKRKRLEKQSEIDQADGGWNHPLKLLVRKELSVSDVGDLGRIIIPKKRAESQFPQIDAREGALLAMEDYSASRRWIFRLKFWTNNKSRMYVLENTGPFINYHNLKEHDSFAVYEDSSKKWVVRGHKGTDLNSTLAILQGSKVKSPDKASSTEDEGPAYTAGAAVA